MSMLSSLAQERQGVRMIGSPLLEWQNPIGRHLRDVWKTPSLRTHENGIVSSWL